jgi:KDO2-lipid IV(A) lauroyltransferase
MSASPGASFSSLMAEGAITGRTRLRLFPTIIKAAADQYLVIRRDTGKMVQTSASGIESIRLLQDGMTIDAARAALGATYGCDLAEIDVMPLIECLVESDFVEEIDGRRISSRPGIGDTLRGIRDAYIRAPLMAAAIRRAPLGITLRVMLRTRAGSDGTLLRQVAENMRRVAALARPGVDIDRLALQNCAVLRRFFFERMLLAALPPARLDRWLRQRARVDGLAHLDRALAGGRGAILCAFHVASYSMVPFILAARGYGQTALMEATTDSADQIRRRIEELGAAGYRYALNPVSLGYGVRTLARELERGGSVLLLFDPTVPEEREHVKIPFLGGTLRVPKGVAWLARRAGAPVLPVSLETGRRARYRLVIHPPVTAATPDEATGTREVLAAVGAVLERDVLARPEAWLKWKDFHIIVDQAERTAGGAS